MLSWLAKLFQNYFVYGLQQIFFQTENNKALYTVNLYSYTLCSYTVKQNLLYKKHFIQLYSKAKPEQVDNISQTYCMFRF